MVLGDGVKVGSYIWRSCKLFGYLLASFTRMFGGVWVDRANVIVLLWGLVLRVIMLGKLPCCLL